MFRYRRKAQAGIELIFLFGLLAFTFSAGYLVFLENNTQIAKNQIGVEARNTVQEVAFEINNALNQGPGFSKNFTLPTTIHGNQYSITVNDSLAILRVKEDTYLSRVSVETITGTIANRKNMVQNLGGIINVTPL